MKYLKYAVLSGAIALAMPWAAQAQVQAPAGAASQSMTSGVVKKVDVEQSKLTLKHEALVNLDMPAMTMVFRVADPALLSSVQAGDNVRFVADKVNGAFTVVRLEKAH